MRESNVNKSIQDIKSDGNENNEDLIMISVRLGMQLSSLLDSFLKITNKKPSALLTDEISYELKELVIKKKVYAKAIENACQRLLDENGYISLQSGTDCLSLLRKEKIIHIDNNYDFELAFKEKKE